jgi:hypothetical protein
MTAAQQGAHSVDRLGAIGKSGQNPQHLQRALFSFFGRPKGSPDFTWVPLPLLIGKQVRTSLHPVLLPHLYFSSLYHHRQDLWQNSVVGTTDGGVASFWRDMQDHAIVKQHPYLDPAAWSRTIPVGLHGDGGSFYKHESMFVFTWNSLLGTGTTIAKRFVLTVLRKSQVVPATLDALFEVFAWSFNVLLTGLTPSVDWRGAPVGGGQDYLCGGYRGSLIQVRGDWEFHCQIFRLPKWSHGGNMCWMCGATAEGDLRFTDCTAGAAWRRTRRTHESYCQEVEDSGQEVPILLRDVQGLRLDSIMIDVLHTVDLELSCHIVANVFLECVNGHVWGGTTQQRGLDELNRELKAYYKTRRGVSKTQGDLTIERLRTSNSWPKLKAKAAATRHVAAFALDLASRFLDRRRVLLCKMLCRFYDILESEGQFLSDSAKAELPGLGRRLCELYCSLSAQYLAMVEISYLGVIQITRED